MINEDEDCKESEEEHSSPTSDRQLPTSSEPPLQITVESRAHGWRLDHYLVRLFPNYSRELFQKAIKQHLVLLNGLAAKPAFRLRVNDRISIQLPHQADNSLIPEDIPLDILYEDDAIVIVNKQANMIVHPGKANYRGTLAGALQFHFDQLSTLAGQHRPGIVHRLDRDTTGVLVVAKDNQVHHKLSRQFEARTVKKEYLAIAWGEVEFDSDYIETHLRVHPKHREKMQVCQPESRSREAITYYEVEQRFKGFTYIRLYPKTGRTHQLRVHLKHLRHPILADRLYEGHAELNSSELKISARELGGVDRILLTRQALHAFRLEFEHPRSGQSMRFEAPLPEDMKQTLSLLQQYCAH